MAESSSTPQEITDNDKLMSLLSYVIWLIVPLVVLLSESGKTRAFQKYHAIQSLGVLVVAIIFDVVVSLCGCLGSAVLAAVTAGLGSLLTVCVPFLGFVPWAVSIYYGIQAYQGKYVEIPYLTNFMVQQGWLEKH
jgi:uncharacterized membrane protein